jgi:hypothetical protein
MLDQVHSGGFDGVASLSDLDNEGNPLDAIIGMAEELRSSGIRSARQDKAKLR